MLNNTDDITEIILNAAEKARAETDMEPEPDQIRPANWPIDCTVGPGLEGAIACESKIGYVNGSKGWLVYRGYDIFDLCAYSSFEEVSFLLLHGELPSKSELSYFKKKLVEYRYMNPVLRTLMSFPIEEFSTMAALRIGTNFMRHKFTYLDREKRHTDRSNVIASDEDSIAMETLPKGNKKAIYEFAYKTGKRKVKLKGEYNLEDGSSLESCYHLISGVASTLSDLYFSVGSGIGALNGPLHGGANEQVVKNLNEIGSEENVKPWIDKVLKSKKRVAGFGHRVYKAYDPRARILGPLSEHLVKECSKIKPLYEIAKKLEVEVISKLGKKKKIFPNVDFYSGIVYSCLGINPDMFTPIFAVSRVSGWTSRILEYLQNNRIFRPRALYTGDFNREYINVSKRK